MMSISHEEHTALRQLEESLWIAETRFDLDYMQRILAPDFFEFGRSGKVYNREATLAIPPQDIKATLPLKNFEVHPLDDHVILITYVSEVAYEKAELANRSSIWICSESGWQLRFHQGTPVN